MMNQSGFLPITCNLLKAREKSRVRDEIDFGLVSHWLKKWREIFQPNTKLSNSTRAITFDSHLKTALSFDFLKKKKQTKKNNLLRAVSRTVCIRPQRRG